VLSKGGDIFNPLLISQSIVGIAGGATRAALVQHQARRGRFNNLQTIAFQFLNVLLINHSYSHELSTRPSLLFSTTNNTKSFTWCVFG